MTLTEKRRHRNFLRLVKERGISVEALETLDGWKTLQNLLEEARKPAKGKRAKAITDKILVELLDLKP